MALVNVDISKLAEVAGKVADDLFTSDEERQAGTLKLQQVLQQPHVLQAMANIEQAKSTNWFVAGGRPALLWLCAAALAYHWMLKDFITMAIIAWGETPAETIKLLPVLDGGEITGLVLALLGLGGLRTYEKINKVAREQ